MTVAAMMQPSQLCTTLIWKWSQRKMPSGRRFENSNRRKKPATVGGSTIGSVRIPSTTALTDGRSCMIFRAAQMPRKKQRIVATHPVFSEIQSGLQSSSRINAIKLSIFHLLLMSTHDRFSHAACR